MIPLKTVGLELLDWVGIDRTAGLAHLTWATVSELRALRSPVGNPCDLARLDSHWLNSLWGFKKSYVMRMQREECDWRVKRLHFDG